MGSPGRGRGRETRVHVQPALGYERSGPAATQHVRFEKAFGELALDVLGTDALVVKDDDPYRPNRWQTEFFGSRSSTIWGGTAEIQRNIVVERVLGLPRDRVQD